LIDSQRAKERKREREPLENALWTLFTRHSNYVTTVVEEKIMLSYV
jgi:hypothetical protein